MPESAHASVERESNKLFEAAVAAAAFERTISATQSAYASIALSSAAGPRSGNSLKKRDVSCSSLRLAARLKRSRNVLVSCSPSSASVWTGARGKSAVGTTASANALETIALSSELARWIARVAASQSCLSRASTTASIAPWRSCTVWTMSMHSLTRDCVLVSYKREKDGERGNGPAARPGRAPCLRPVPPCARHGACHP